MAGCCAAYSRDDRVVAAAIVVLSLPDLTLVEQVSTVGTSPIPAASFREASPLLAAFEKLRAAPDVLLVDGPGIAHPRGFGLASHLGLLFDLPAIGCAKTQLSCTSYELPGNDPGLVVRRGGSPDPPIRGGEYEEPVRLRGAYSFLKDAAGDIVGAALRTTKEGKPHFISTGHKMTLDLAMDVVLASCGTGVIPKPLRLADKAARAALRAA